MHKEPMTIAGADKLREELNRLKTNDRRQIIAAIAEARAHGDLKENAEYHAAKERQGFIEGRIHEIESYLSHSHIIDVSKLPQNNKVVFGVTMTLLNIEDEKKIRYQIVGVDEADLKHHKISYKSPIARALISKEVGDVVVVQTPSGEVEYEILQIEYL